MNSLKQFRFNLRHQRHTRTLGLFAIGATICLAMSNHCQFDTASQAQMHTLKTGMPDDPHFKEQWYLHNTGQNGGKIGEDINAPQAWSQLPLNGKSIVVALIDQGIHWQHPYLANKIWTNPKEVAGNGIDDDMNGFIDDIHGWNFADNDNDVTPGDLQDGVDHGTWVAGVIAATTNSPRHLASGAPPVHIMPICVAGNEATTYDEIRAVNYAVNNGARVICYCGYTQFLSPDWFQVLKRCRDAGVVFVAAAGNEAENADQRLQLLSSANDMLVVAGTTNRGDLSRNSSYGTSVNIAAPSERIWTTEGTSAYHEVEYGTSFATPQVAAAAAMVLFKYPHLTPAEVCARLKYSSVVHPSMVGKISGGRLDIGAALRDYRTTLATPQITNIKQIAPDRIELHFRASRPEHGKEVTHWYQVCSSNQPISEASFNEAIPSGDAYISDTNDQEGITQVKLIGHFQPGARYFFGVRSINPTGKHSKLTVAEYQLSRL